MYQEGTSTTSIPFTPTTKAVKQLTVVTGFPAVINPFNDTDPAGVTEYVFGVPI